uniref:Carboxypeptidase n=1 Tax=Fagus sylvatica TaxID=28930 RepID=A0A2N9I564_FAGSY
MLSLPWKTIAMTVVALLHPYFFTEVESSPSLLDRINQLPGQPPVTFQQYSGYVTVDDKSQRALFYYFAEAEVDPASKPLVLWLNGGPGCSSLGVGAFSENGPFRPSGEVLVKNQYSWNRGYLYWLPLISETLSSSLSFIARDNVVFLQRWFERFPLYRNRSLFITGESYAGHYVPQLAELMLQFNKKENLFNLKGIALGNPVLEFATDFNSRAEFFWSHGLISDTTYKMFTSVCNYSRYFFNTSLLLCPNSILDYELLDLEIPTISIVGNIIKAGIPVLVYSGDQDSVIPLTGSRTLVHGLAEELGLKTNVPYRVWFEGQQVGGWTQVYGNILSFATVRGASHEAPFSQPERSLVLFRSFLNGHPLPEAF